MNRGCSGDFFVVDDGGRYYRCFYDGAILKADKDLKNGDVCPWCKRIIVAGDDLKARIRIMKQVQIPDITYNNSWINLEELKPDKGLVPALMEELAKKLQNDLMEFYWDGMEDYIKCLIGAIGGISEDCIISKSEIVAFINSTKDSIRQTKKSNRI